MNKKIVIASLFVFLGFGLAVYQYALEFRSDFANAYSTSKPANGHSWTEMECTSDLCITGGKVGVGTDNPTVKLQVVGDFKASGDVCNGTGNCLSSLATLTNACGGAATNYVYSATAFSGTYCAMGNPTPATPSFPAAGSSTTWTCPVANGSPISCTATHAAAPVNGVCGPAATNYAYSASAFSGALCSTGTASPASPAFPGAGSSVSWSCLGANGGSSPSCTAIRSNPLPLVNSVHTEASCTAAGGTVVPSDVSYSQCKFNASACPSGWTWYKNYATIPERAQCVGSFCCASPGCWCSAGGGSCAIEARAFANGATSCSYSYCAESPCGSGTATCSASITQIGCY